MNITKTEINNKITYLVDCLNKLEKIYDSIETPEQYTSFHTACGNVVNYCNVWSKRLKPSFFKFIQRKRTKLYDDFNYAATYVVSMMNNMIDSYIDMENEMKLTLQRQQEIEERIRIERAVHEAINEEQDNKIKKSSKPIGFIIGTKKKRKYTKKNNKDD